MFRLIPIYTCVTRALWGCTVPFAQNLFSSSALFVLFNFLQNSTFSDGVFKPEEPSSEFRSFSALKQLFQTQKIRNSDVSGAQNLFRTRSIQELSELKHSNLKIKKILNPLFRAQPFGIQERSELKNVIQNSILTQNLFRTQKSYFTLRDFFFFFLELNTFSEKK